MVTSLLSRLRSSVVDASADIFFEGYKTSQIFTEEELGMDGDIKSFGQVGCFSHKTGSRWVIKKVTTSQFSLRKNSNWTVAAKRSTRALSKSPDS